MREDHEEALMKMFPKGYLITYVQPNNDVAYHWHNPNNDLLLTDILEAFDYIFRQEGLSNDEFFE